jgi:hypothetical protein
MKNYLAFLLMFVTSILISQNTLKFNELNGSPKAKLKQVSWISGNWMGEAFDGIIEENWSAPLGDSMMGAFKLVVNNKVEFYELCTISEEDDSLIFRLKHFSNNLKGWEEKDEMITAKLVKIENQKVYFNDFTFERIDNELNIYVVFKEENGVEQEMKFNYKLKN